MARGSSCCRAAAVMMAAAPALAADTSGAVSTPYLQIQSALADDQRGQRSRPTRWRVAQAAATLGRAGKSDRDGRDGAGSAAEIDAARETFGTLSEAH